MAIKLIKGNIFTSNCKTIVNTVNCVGVMGAGIALECRLRYPNMHDRYKELCNQNLIQIGKLWLYKSDDKWVLNFPTKRDWKHPSRLEFVEAGLKKFTTIYKDKNIDSIAFPMLGADRGGLDSETILGVMKKYLDPLAIDVEIYQYDPKATDDLYGKLYEFLTLNDIEFLSNATKLRRDYVMKAINAIKQDDIVQLNQLGRVKGVGIKTLEKLFHAAQNSSNLKQDTLF